MQLLAKYAFSRHPAFKSRPYSNCCSKGKHPVTVCQASVCTTHNSPIYPTHTNCSPHTEAAYMQKAPAACAGRGSIEKTCFF